MTEGMTCYERDEALCEDQMCLRTGCRLRNAALASAATTAEPVGYAGVMPGTSGFTMACFQARDIPVGTALYTAPPASGDVRAAVIAECAREAERLYEKPGWSPHYKNAALTIAGFIRALSQAPVTDGVESPETFEEWLTRTAAHALSSAAESRSIAPDSWGSGFDTGYSDALEHAKAHFKAMIA